MKRLCEFVPKEDTREFVQLEDIAGEEVVIESVTFREGMFGEYVIMILRTQSDSLCSVVTGAAQIVAALKAAKTAEAFPVSAVFERRGRRWVVK